MSTAKPEPCIPYNPFSMSLSTIAFLISCLRNSILFTLKTSMLISSVHEHPICLLKPAVFSERARVSPAMLNSFPPLIIFFFSPSVLTFSLFHFTECRNVQRGYPIFFFIMLTCLCHYFLFLCYNFPSDTWSA